MKKKRAITLIELLIVILLIGIIGGALAFNMKGSLNKGKVFKTEEGMRTIKDILLLEIAQGKTFEQDKWADVVRASPLAGRPEELIKDGWGHEYKVSVKDNEVDVQSIGLNKHNESTK